MIMILLPAFDVEDHHFDHRCDKKTGWKAPDECIVAISRSAPPPRSTSSWSALPWWRSSWSSSSLLWLSCAAFSKAVAFAANWWWRFEQKLFQPNLLKTHLFVIYQWYRPWIEQFYLSLFSLVMSNIALRPNKFQNILFPGMDVQLQFCNPITF